MKPIPRPSGVHVSISGGFCKALDRATGIGCTAMQVFVGNPRGWSPINIADNDAAEFIRQRPQKGMRCVVAHAIYLINLASADTALYKKSVAALTGELKAAAKINADFYVIHPGRDKAGDMNAAIQRITAALDSAFDNAASCPPVLLEGTAGGTSDVGSKFDQLAAIIDKCAHKDALGVCLDTAHLFAAGYDISTKGAVKKVIDDFSNTVGLSKLKVIHTNDSKAGLETHIDRHEHIGKGTLGKAGLAAFLTEKRIKDIPLILETPVDSEGDDLKNLKLIRSIL